MSPADATAAPLGLPAAAPTTRTAPGAVARSTVVAWAVHVARSRAAVVRRAAFESLIGALLRRVWRSGSTRGGLPLPRSRSRAEGPAEEPTPDARSFEAVAEAQGRDVPVLEVDRRCPGPARTQADELLDVLE